MGAKEQIIEAISTFAHSKVDEYLSTFKNPLISMFSKDIKQGVTNYIDNKLSQEIDRFIPFITDNDGDINILQGKEFEDLEAMFDEMPQTMHDLGMAKAQIGKGSIDIFLNIPFVPKDKSLSFNFSDVAELKDLITKK